LKLFPGGDSEALFVRRQHVLLLLELELCFSAVEADNRIAGLDKAALGDNPGKGQAPQQQGVKLFLCEP